MVATIIGATILTLLLAFFIFAIGFAPGLLEIAFDDFFVIIVTTIIALVLLIVGLINTANQMRRNEDTILRLSCR